MGGEQREFWVGTQGGVYRFCATVAGGDWRRQGPFLADEDVATIARGPGGQLLVGTHAGTIFRSDDCAASWRKLAFDNKQAELNAYYAACTAVGQPNGTRESGIWALAFSPHDPQVIYAGTLPAALFRSVDGGERWAEVAGLRRHPASREFWGPFNAPFLHTIIPDTADPDRLTIAVGVGGILGTADGGETWAIMTDGIIDPYVPEGAQFPEVHKDIHKLRAAPSLPQRLYITEHGPWISRSDDGGQHWQRLAAGHERAVTRPLALHPRDPDHLWLALLEDEPGSDGIPRVYRKLEVLESRDGGLTWADRSAGLPERRCSIYRDAMDSDRPDPTGIAFGTNRGDLYFLTEDGEGWERIAADLPSIRTVVAT